jgi:hypothetical protein
MDAAVIDLKHDQAHRRPDCSSPSSRRRQVTHPRARHRARARDRGVYTIARIVCFNDPSLPNRKPTGAPAFLDRVQRRKHQCFESPAHGDDGSRVDGRRPEHAPPRAQLDGHLVALRWQMLERCAQRFAA